MTKKVKCLLCGHLGTTDDGKMMMIVSPTIGPVADFAMATDWICENPCYYSNFKHSQDLRKRVYQRHDRATIWANACIRRAPVSLVETFEDLPPGLRVESRERRRAEKLHPDLENIEKLQDMDDLLILHKICRNVNHNRFYHQNIYYTYDTLKSAFIQLARS